MQSLLADQTHPVLVSGTLVLQKNLFAMNSDCQRHFRHICIFKKNPRFYFRFSFEVGNKDGKDEMNESHCQVNFSSGTAIAELELWPRKA